MAHGQSQWIIKGRRLNTLWCTCYRGCNLRSTFSQWQIMSKVFNKNFFPTERFTCGPYAERRSNKNFKDSVWYQPSFDTRNASCRGRKLQNFIPTPLHSTLTPIDSSCGPYFRFLLHANGSFFEGKTFNFGKHSAMLSVFGRWEGEGGTGIMSETTEKHWKRKSMLSRWINKKTLTKQTEKAIGLFHFSTFFRVSTVSRGRFFLSLFMWIFIFIFFPFA